MVLCSALSAPADGLSSAFADVLLSITAQPADGGVVHLAAQEEEDVEMEEAGEKKRRRGSR